MNANLFRSRSTNARSTPPAIANPQNMKNQNSKTAPGQMEFSFVQGDDLKAPQPDRRNLCVANLPKQQVGYSRCWVPIFADRPPGPNQFSTKRQRRLTRLDPQAAKTQIC
jgi:hypothetical protein